MTFSSFSFQLPCQVCLLFLKAHIHLNVGTVLTGNQMYYLWTVQHTIHKGDCLILCDTVTLHCIVSVCSAKRPLTSLQTSCIPFTEKSSVATVLEMLRIHI